MKDYKSKIIRYSAFTLFFILCITYTLIGVNSKEEEKYFNLFKRVYQKLRDEYVEEKSPKDLFVGAIDGMIKSLNDPHTAFLKPQQREELQIETKGEYGGLGIVIGIRDNKLTVISPIEDTPAERAGIQAGDKIVKINGEDVKDPKLDEVVKQLRGKPGTEVTISIEREGVDELIDYTLTRETIKLKAVKSAVIKTNIGYVKIISFNKNAPEELKESLEELKKKKIKGLIVDVRNNPGGLLDVAVKIVDFFISDGLIVYTRARKGVFNPFLNQDYYAHRQRTLIPDDMPMVVLINHGSASASEIFAGAIQDHKRGIIVGLKSFGKASVQSVIDLDDGYGLRYTTAFYYTPNGRKIHKKGIEPDIEVEQIKLSKRELKDIRKVEKKKYIKEFLKENPEYTEKDIDALMRKLQEDDIYLDRIIVKNLIKNEEYKKKKRPIYDLETDLQLKMAVQIISMEIKR